MPDHHELLINCPLCRKQFLLDGASNHRRKSHKNMSMAEFVDLIRVAKREGELLFKRTSVEGSSNTATLALRDKSRITSKVPIRVLNGGFGVKK